MSEQRIQELIACSTRDNSEYQQLKVQKSFHGSQFNAGYTVQDAQTGDVGPRRRDKLALVGALPAHRSLVPWQDPAYEIWGMNRFWFWMYDKDQRLRADRWFELHPMEAQEPVDFTFFKHCPIPLYILYDTDLQHCPTGAVYPLDQVSTLVPHQYFTSTFAYQLALAIYEGFTEIYLFGMVFGGGRERLVERTCFEFWCGVAIAKGIQVIHVQPTPGLPMMRSEFLYGYDYWDEKRRMEQECLNAIPAIVKDAFHGSE